MLWFDASYLREAVEVSVEGNDLVDSQTVHVRDIETINEI
ncbi:hypothetical protein BH23CHL4_BH23CHL4_14600 [soil metagenome]